MYHCTLLPVKTKQALAAKRHLEEMREPLLSVELPAPRTTGESPSLVLRTRNLRELSGRIYRLDPDLYFRKHGGLTEIDRVMFEVVPPSARFSHTVKDYEDYRLIEGELPVPVPGPGAYATTRAATNGPGGSPAPAAGLPARAATTAARTIARQGTLALVIIILSLHYASRRRRRSRLNSHSAPPPSNPNAAGSGTVVTSTSVVLAYSGTKVRCPPS